MYFATANFHADLQKRSKVRTGFQRSKHNLCRICLVLAPEPSSAHFKTYATTAAMWGRPLWSPSLGSWKQRCFSWRKLNNLYTIRTLSFSWTQLLDQIWCQKTCTTLTSRHLPLPVRLNLVPLQRWTYWSKQCSNVHHRSFDKTSNCS